MALGHLTDEELDNLNDIFGTRAWGALMKTLGISEDILKEQILASEETRDANLNRGRIFALRAVASLPDRTRSERADRKSKKDLAS